MTPEQARQKWCPMARTLDQNSMAMSQSAQGITGSGVFINNMPPPQPGVAAVNRSGGMAHYNCKCIASECMMWREHPLEPGHGFCGLAGGLLVPNP